MRRDFFLVVLSVAIAGTAQAGTLTVTPDAASYTVGQTITLTVVGDSLGASSRGIWGRLLYSAALTDPSGIAPTQNTHVPSPGPVLVGPLDQGEGYAGFGYSDAFNQIFTGFGPSTVGENTTSVIKVIAAAEGTLDFFFEEPVDGLGNHLVYFGTTPFDPAATVTIPEPGATIPIALGLFGLLLSPRRRSIR